MSSTWLTLNCNSSVGYILCQSLSANALLQRNMHVRVFTDCLNGGVVGVFDSKTKMHFPSSFPPCHIVAAAVIRLVAKVITRDGRTEGAEGRTNNGRTDDGKSWRRCGKWSVSDREGGERGDERKAFAYGRLGRERNEEMSGM